MVSLQADFGMQLSALRTEMARERERRTSMEATLGRQAERLTSLEAELLRESKDMGVDSLLPSRRVRRQTQRFK